MFRTIPNFGVDVIEITIGNFNRSLGVSHAFDDRSRMFDHIHVADMLRKLADELMKT